MRGGIDEKWLKICIASLFTKKADWQERETAGTERMTRIGAVGL